MQNLSLILGILSVINNVILLSNLGWLLIFNLPLTFAGLIISIIANKRSANDESNIKSKIGLVLCTLTLLLYAGFIYVLQMTMNV